MLASQLAQAVVRTYDAFQLDRGPALDATKSVMYASANQPDRRVLNVPLRTLVDNNTLTGVEARLLSSLLNLKRTIIVSGAPERRQVHTAERAHRPSLPRDHRLVVRRPTSTTSCRRCETVRSRSQLTAKRGHARSRQRLPQGRGHEADLAHRRRTAAPRRAGLLRSAAVPGTSGLATVESPDPELTIADWLSMSREIGEQLTTVKPLFVHMERDQGGSPRVQSTGRSRSSTGDRPSVTRYWGT